MECAKGNTVTFKTKEMNSSLKLLSVSKYGKGYLTYPDKFFKEYPELLEFSEFHELNKRKIRYLLDDELYKLYSHNIRKASLKETFKNPSTQNIDNNIKLSAAFSPFVVGGNMLPILSVVPSYSLLMTIPVSLAFFGVSFKMIQKKGIFKELRNKNKAKRITKEIYKDKENTRIKRIYTKKPSLLDYKYEEDFRMNNMYVDHYDLMFLRAYYLLSHLQYLEEIVQRSEADDYARRISSLIELIKKTRNIRVELEESFENNLINVFDYEKAKRQIEITELLIMIRSVILEADFANLKRLNKELLDNKNIFKSKDIVQNSEKLLEFATAQSRENNILNNNTIQSSRSEDVVIMTEALRELSFKES